MISWTIDSAICTGLIDRVVLSTDNADIAQVGKASGAEVPFIRPEDLSTDTASTAAVVLHAIDTLDLPDNGILVILQPTSPLRISSDIEQALLLFSEKDAEGVVSVCECEHNPHWANTLPLDGSMTNFLREDLLASTGVAPKYYRLNGAVYIYAVGAIKDNKGLFYREKVYAYEMPQARSVDVDTSLDFMLAETLKYKNIQEFMD